MKSKYHEEYYKRNRDEILAQQREYRAEHSEKVREYQREYRRKHKEKHKKQNAEWYKRNIDHVRESNKRNSVRRLAWNAQWIRKHPEVAARRRTRKTQAGGSFTAAEWNALCRQCKHRCLCCGKRRKLTADHVVPVSKGGDSSISNIQPLCKPCNSRKGTKATDYRKTN